MTVVPFRKKLTPTPILVEPTNINTTPDPVKDMIYSIQEWALKNDIDIQTLDFKYEAATIMSVLQGMYFKRNR